MQIVRSVFALTLLLVLVGCSSGGGGNDSPTAPPTPPPPPPPPTANNLVTLSLAFVVNLIDGSPGGAVIEAALLLDGEEIDREDWSSIGGCVVCGFPVITVEDLPFGTHSLALRPIGQTHATLRYTVDGVVVVSDLDTGSQSTIEFNQRTVNLQVGETTTFNFDV